MDAEAIRQQAAGIFLSADREARKRGALPPLPFSEPLSFDASDVSSSHERAQEEDDYWYNETRNALNPDGIHREHFNRTPLIALVAAALLLGLFPPPAGAAPEARIEKGRSGTWGPYQVAYEPVPDPIPLNELFRLRVTVRDRAGRLVPGVDLAASAAMPEHQHGMTLEPKVRKTGEGSFEVEGMLFHMPGRWWIQLDLQGATQENHEKSPKTRAIFEVTLE